VNDERQEITPEVQQKALPQDSAASIGLERCFALPSVRRALVPAVRLSTADGCAGQALDTTQIPWPTAYTGTMP
jgi:hypothetical protein